MGEKNLITFLEEHGGLDSNEICLNGDHFDAEFLEEFFDIIPFQPLTIVKFYEERGNKFIDIKDEQGNITKGISPDLFQPYKSYLNKSYQEYLKNN